MPSPEFVAVAQYLRDTLRLADPDATPQDLRAAMLAGTESGFVPAPSGVTFAPTIAGAVPALWVRPEHDRADATLLYLHGGGYVIGSPDTHRGITARLATLLGCAVLSLDYRLAPEHPHPAAIDDATAAYRWLLEQGFAAGRLALAGDSAGGGLAVATLVKLRDEGVPLPSCAAPISPWVDIAMTGESMRRLADADPMVKPAGLARMAQWFAGGADMHDAYMSPLYADLSGLPPLLVHVGEVETLLDDAVRLAERARRAGVECTLEVFPEMIHVFHVLCGIVPEADAACETVAAFLRKHMSL